MEINDGNLLELEKEYVDVKTEMEEFIKQIGGGSGNSGITVMNPGLSEFKNQMNTLVYSLGSSFDTLSNTKRNLFDIQDKIKRNIRNKNEATKNLEDDRERFNTLKNDYENYFLKIDEKKFQEIEKEKIIKSLNEQIIILNQKIDIENIANFKPIELEINQKLFHEKEEIENKISILREKKHQHMFLENKLTEDRISADKFGQALDSNKDEHDKILKIHEEFYQEEIKLKMINDATLTKKKEDSNLYKSELLRLQDEINSSKKLIDTEKKIEDHYDILIHQKILLINELKKKTIPILKCRIEENKTKRIKQNDDTISELKNEKIKREKDISDCKKEINKIIIQTNENRKIISEIKKNIENLSLEKASKQDEIKILNLEINEKKNVLYAKKSVMITTTKQNDELKREIEKLTSKIKEIDAENISYENSNHRSVNETYGIKRETLQLEHIREVIEKEKNIYAKQASDANMEHTQSLEKLKNLNTAIHALKERNTAAETKLKQQKKIYEALKADSSRFEKKHQDAQREIKEILEEKMKKESKYNVLKIELDYKQSLIKDNEEKLENYQEAVEKSIKEVDELCSTCKNYKSSTEKYNENNTNMKKLMTKAEYEYHNLKKEYNIVIHEKDFLEEQLIERNKEINTLYQKIKTLQGELFKMHQQFESKMLEAEKLKSTREFLYEELEKTEHIIKNIFDLKVVKIKLEKEVLMARNKVRSVEDETRKPLNIHRWTKLEYSDPEKYEIISQISSLQRRLIAKTDEVNQKEELIQEKEKLYVKLKGIVARQSGVEMEEPLSKYKQKIKEETDRLKKLKEDIKNYRMEIKNYEYEIRRIDDQMDKLKRDWFVKNREANREALSFNKGAQEMEIFETENHNYFEEENKDPTDGDRDYVTVTTKNARVDDNSSQGFFSRNGHEYENEIETGDKNINQSREKLESGVAYENLDFSDEFSNIYKNKVNSA